MPRLADDHVYLRIATHPRIFAAPLTPAEALGNVEAPHVRLLSEEQGFLDIYRDVTGSFPVRGNMVPDAHLVALLKQHGVRTLFTRDGDFRKFDFPTSATPSWDSRAGSTRNAQPESFGGVQSRRFQPEA